MAAAAAGRERGRARRRASGAGASGGGSRGTRGAGAAGWTARSPPGLSAWAPARPPSPPRGRHAGVHTLRTLPGRGQREGPCGSGQTRARDGGARGRGSGDPECGESGRGSAGEPRGDPGTPGAEHSAEQRRHLAPARQPRSSPRGRAPGKGRLAAAGREACSSEISLRRNADPPPPLTGGWPGSSQAVCF